MTGERDPLLAAELARRPVFDHRPGFWDDLDRALRSDEVRPGPADHGELGPAGRGADAQPPPRIDRRGHRRPRPGRHHGRWLLAAAMALVAGGLASTLLPDRGGRTTSISTDDPTATTAPAPVVVGGPARIVDRDGEPLTSDLAVQVALATVDDLLATDPRYLGTDDADERARLLADGGVTIRTTIDSAAQRAALDARRNAGDGAGNGATVTAIDPATGAIVAAVDDDPVADSLFRRTVRPSDGFMAVVLAAAFDRGGVVPEDTIDGRGPCEFEMDGLDDPYQVVNHGQAPGAVATVRQQVIDRSDCAWVRLGLAVGLDTIVDTATALGVTGGVSAYPSLPLGAADVSVVDLTSAYATLAADGQLREPFLIERVTQGERVLYDHGAPVAQPAVSADSACRVTSVLASVRTADESEVVDPEAAGIGGRDGFSGAGIYTGFTASLAVTVSIELSGVDDAAAAATAVWNQFVVGYRPASTGGGGSPIELCPEPGRDPQPVVATP